MSRLATSIFWLAKAGNASDEYEDAFFLSKSFTGRPPRAALAIADGATESLLSGKWASLLVKRFVRHWQTPGSLDEWLLKTLRAWQDEKREYLKQREQSNRPVQWYEEPGLEAGAFAALLGMVVTGMGRGERGAPPLTWRAIAIGDCCLFQVRAQELVCAFPLDSSDAFNNRPLLLSSNPARNKGVVERFQFAEGNAFPGDSFYMMSDALAFWFARAHERDSAPWRALDALSADDGGRAFAGWVEELRAARAMRNDDVTLIRFEVLNS